MPKPMMRTSPMSASAKAAVAMWLAQAPQAPAGEQRSHRALCAKLARSAKRAAAR